VTPRTFKQVRDTAIRLAVRRGEFIQLRRQLLGKTWLWAAALIVVGSLLLARGAVRRYPMLAAGAVAPADIIIAADVAIPDPEATEKRRREASIEVRPVYVLDPGVERAVVAKLEAMFAAGHAAGRTGAEELALRVSEATGVLVLPQEAAALKAAGFSDELLAVLRDVVTRLYRQGVVSSRPELLLAADRGLTLRTAGAAVERVELDVYRFVDGGAGLAEAVDQRLGGEAAVRRGARGPLAALLARLLAPNVIEDRGETLARRLRAASAVESVVVRLPRGRVLVRRGDEVTPQTARLLQALAASSRPAFNPLSLLGTFVLVSLVTAAWYFFLQRQGPSPEEFRYRFGSVVILTLTMLLLERASAFLAGGVAASIVREEFGHVDVYLPALPHGAGPIVAGLMFGVPVAVLFALVQAVLVSMFLGGEVGVAVYALLTGLGAAFVSQRLKERNAFLRAGLFVAGVNALAVLGLVLWHGRLTDGPVVAAQVTAGAVGGMLAAVLASFLVPLIETLTGTITDIRLLELSNPNLPLLKRLSVEAPGTFQHSLAMANLAEAAAESVGANPLLARVCCYYHDIGKLAKPEYFVENQRGANPHDTLSPWMSALVVSNHVKAGLELARQYKLPEAIRDAIVTHHGNKLIRYFFSRAKEKESADSGEVKEHEFRYPGPKPRSKEMGILLLADAVEAGSRTVQEPTPGRIQGMIDQIVKNVLEDGQLDECDLTLKDIERISAAFFWVLTNAFHHRIDYPGFDFNKRRG
jgi:putative nucleotidyltransferase with HDIG domain